VIGALPKALRRRGIDVRIVLPLYAGMPWHRFEPLEGILSVPMWFGHAQARVRLARLPGSEVPVYFLEHHRYFDRPHLYGPVPQSYPDNLERFAFLSRGALELTKALGWIPDVIHANDWQTALVPVYVDTVEWGQPLRGVPPSTDSQSAYQGVFDSGVLQDRARLGHYHAREFEHSGTVNPPRPPSAAAAHTVSPTYARD
jgi:starch synthase